MADRKLGSQMRQGAIDAFVMRCLGLGLLFLMHMLLGRALGPKQYGIFSYALSLGGFLAVIAPLGWPTAMMRFIGQYSAEKKWALLRGAFIRANQITFASSVLMAMALWGISCWLPFTSRVRMSVHFAALLLPILAYVQLRRKIFQGLKRVRWSIVPDEVVVPLLVISGVLAFATTTASKALTVYLVASLAVVLFSLFWLWRSMPFEVRQVQPILRTRTWLGIAFPMMLGGISQIVMNRTDVLMLGAMVNMKAVGLYSAANRIAVLNTFVLGAVNTIAAPMLAQSHHSGHSDQFIRIFRRAMLWSTLGALPLFALMIAWPQGMLNLFGGQFVQGSALLRILSLGQFVNAFTGPVGFALLMTGREGQFALSMAFVAGANVMGNFIIIPFWGALGAAWVTAGSIMVLNGWQYRLAMKHKAENCAA